MKQSAGTLLYRRGSEGLEVLLVHPSGNYNRKAPWGIPKGEIEEGDSPEETARARDIGRNRSCRRALVEIGFIDYVKSRKRIFAFVGSAPADAAPTCASWEVDQSCFVSLERARQLIHPDQAPFLDRLLEHLGG